MPSDGAIGVNNTATTMNNCQDLCEMKITQAESKVPIKAWRWTSYP